MLRSETESESTAHQVARLEKLIPPAKLAAILRRIAERGEELQRQGAGADVELHVRFVRGRFFEARWDGDERIA